MKKIISLIGGLALSAGLAAAEPFNLVSYNIRFAASSDQGTRAWDARKGRVAKYLKESKAEIFGLQEALNHQLAFIDQAMPDFKFIGVGRDDGKKKGEYSPVFFDSKKWTPDSKEQGTFWLSDTPEVPGSMSWGNEIPRVCSWARFVSAEGKGLYVYNSHWDHRSQPSREKAAELILARIAKRRHAEEPVVLMGDFNATTKNPAIKTLLKSGLLRDTGGVEQHLSFNLWKPGLVSGLRIDHIFTTESVKAAKLEVISNGDPVGADHHPIILRGVKF
ncbi:endonuclease/exonuclease/phosphatase family protein [Verrucomicrobiaceae bacterium 227]